MRSISERAAWAIAGALALAVVALAARAVQGGPLDPDAPPASTRSEIEPRIALHPPSNPAALPIVISKPGSYYLADNLTSAGNDGIRIDASDVTLDLNGFTLTSNLSGMGVSANGALENIVVRNGVLREWDTALDFRDDVNVTMEQVNLDTGLTYGVWLGAESTVRDCHVEGFLVGVYVDDRNSAIERCRIEQNRATGIQVQDSHTRIVNNVIRVNGLTVASPGIDLNSSLTLVDSNVIVSNLDYGIRTDGFEDRIIRNVFNSNSPSAISNLLCAFCDIGPLTFAGGTTSPWANLDQQ